MTLINRILVLGFARSLSRTTSNPVAVGEGMTIISHTSAVYPNAILF